MLRVYGIETFIAARWDHRGTRSSKHRRVAAASGMPGSNHCWLKHSQRTVYAPLRIMRTGGLRVIRARFTCSGAQGR